MKTYEKRQKNDVLTTVLVGQEIRPVAQYDRYT